jgi:hypothetical protein
MICSADSSLKTIEMVVRDRGQLYGLGKEASRIADIFQTVVPLNSLRTTVSATHNEGNTQCGSSASPIIPIQQTLNSNIVKETKQIIQNLTDFVVALNFTINDCPTAEILSTFVSRAANMIPGVSNISVSTLPVSIFDFLLA